FHDNALFRANPCLTGGGDRLMTLGIDLVEAWKRRKIVAALWIIESATGRSRGGPAFLVVLQRGAKDLRIEDRHFSSIVVRVEIRLVARVSGGIFRQAVITQEAVIDDRRMVAERSHRTREPRGVFQPGLQSRKSAGLRSEDL